MPALRNRLVSPALRHRPERSSVTVGFGPSVEPGRAVNSRAMKRQIHASVAGNDEHISLPNLPRFSVSQTRRLAV